MAAAAEDHAVADAQDRLRTEVQVGHQARGEGDLLGDDAVGAEPDPGFTEDRAEREGQTGGFADGAEAVSRGALGRDGPVALHPGPGRVYGSLGEAPSPG